MKIKAAVKRFLTPDKLRFILVGFANTAIDFTVLFILLAIGMNIIVANFISTSVAFIFSFIANKNYTFRDTEKTSPVMIIKFITVTLIAAWGIQPIVIGFTKPLLLNFFDEPLANFFSKCLAIGVGLVWNYTLYSHFVFKQNKKTRKTNLN